MKPQDQKRMLVEVVERVLHAQAPDPAALEQLIFDTIFFERQRLEHEKNKERAKQDRSFYGKIYHQALTGGPERHRELLGQIIGHFAKEVLGHFNQTMYQVATQMIPVGLNLLLNTLSPLRLIREFPHGIGQLDHQIKIHGETKALQKLAQLGTVILVPTHGSNLDSILIGYSLYRLGLPPFIYGAGLNLYANKIMGFFMDRLGAYKVDRRKKAPLYKEVLKVYAGYSMELGYHNLFFSGGTRSRSGKVESKLKLGLVGMGLDAYVHNLINKKNKPDIFVVPATLNYQLVLEAETLIEDYLKEAGKSRFIIEDDEFAEIKRILAFLSGLFSLDSRIHVVISHPLDVFGNQVTEHGISLDHRGREIDRERYVMKDGKPCFDPQRDQEYTRELGHSIAESFVRDTVLGSVQLVSKVVFDWLQEINEEMDLYRLLRSGGKQESLSLTEAYARIEKTLGVLKEMEVQNKIRLDETLHDSDSVALLSEALAHLKSYHVHPVLERKGDRLFHKDRNLIYFYSNRVPKLEVSR